MTVNVDNSEGLSHIDGVIVKLVQYTFVSANSGVSRTFKKTIHEHKKTQNIAKGSKRELAHVMTVPSVDHQTAISTLVANYFRIEVTANMSTLTSDTPSIYAPLFILKKTFHFKKIK